MQHDAAITIRSTLTSRHLLTDKRVFDAQQVMREGLREKQVAESSVEFFVFVIEKELMTCGQCAVRKGENIILNFLYLIILFNY